MKCMICRYIMKIENDVKRNDVLYMKMKNEIVEMMFYIWMTCLTSFVVNRNYVLCNWMTCLTSLYCN